MSHELHNLVTKIENACDSEFYEVADTEHLVRLAVAEYVVAQNGLVASARVVDPTAVQKVIDRHIRENISAADPQAWFANVATKIADFLELAYEDRTNNESAEHVDLLPIGHPRNTKNLGLTASARMQAVAEWVAADPRITSDLGRQAVYNAYRAKPETLEATYANAKVEALAASGVLPADFAYEAIVASFKKMSFAERSARSKALAAVRRRDRWKRFANEFGRLRGFFSKGDGTMFSATGKIAGAVPGENKYYVEYDGSDPDIPKGVYIQDAGMSENVRATLSKRVLDKATNLRKPVAEFDKRDQSSAVDLQSFLATKVDSPGDWTKNKDGSFSSKTGNKVKEVDSLPEGDYYFEGVGENNEQDLGEPLFEIRDNNDELIGVAQDWNGIQKIALTKDKMKEKAEKKASEINDETFAEALAGLDDETNWDDLDTEPSYESPNGVLSVAFSADADTDGEGGMQDLSGWSATLDPDGEAIDLGSWRGSPDDDLGDIMERVQKGYDEYKAKKAGEAAPAEPEAEAPAKPEVKQTEKSKPSYLDQKPKQYQSTLEKDSLGYSTGVDDDGFVEVRKNENGGYEVNHGFNYMADENSDEIQFDEGSQNFETEKEALDFANEKLAYYNSWRVNEDADAYSRDRWAGFDGYERDQEQGLGQDVPEAEAEAPAKPVKPLSEKQMEPASPKQYALLKEFQEERDGIDENQNQAINDALEKQNLSKAQMAALFGDLQKKPFKPEIDPTKPSDRMINSLRDYLTNKELTPDEINSALDELEAGLDRAGVEKLLAKLRRRPDKAKEDVLGQDIPSDLKGTLTDQQLANGYSFSKSKDGKTWFETGFPDGEEKYVEVTEFNGKWITTEKSGGNGETGFTRESEKQHSSAQDAFDYAAESINRPWDQDLFDDLNNDFGDDEDEIGFAEEEGLGQELPTAGAPDLGNIDADESWTVDTYDNGDPFGTPLDMINSASYTSPDGRVKAEANYDTDGESQGLYLSIELDGKDLDLPRDEYSLGTNADLGDVINAVESAIKRETGAPELSDQDKIDNIDTLTDSEDYYGLEALLGDEAYKDADLQKRILEEMNDLKDGYISRKEAAQSKLDKDLDEALENARESVAEAKLDAGADLRTGDIDQQERDNRIEDLEGDLQEFEEYLSATSSRDASNSTGVLEVAIDLRNSAIEEYDAWEASEPNDLSDVQPGLDTPSVTREQGLGQAAPSTKMAEDATDAQYNYVSSMLNGKEVPEELATAAKQAIEDRNLSKAQVGEIIGKMRDLPNKEGYDPNAPTERMVESVKRNIVAKGLSKEDQDAILAELPNMDKATMSELIGRLKAMDDVNVPEEGLNQGTADQERFKAELDQLAEDMDAIQNQLADGDELKSLIEQYDRNTFVDTVADIPNEIRKLAGYMRRFRNKENDSAKAKNIAERIEAIADKVELDVANRFGVADAARVDEDGRPVDLGDIMDSVETDREIYFETDSEKLADKLRDNNSYGDSKSGGAEVFVYEEEGVWTATVGYDRDSDEFKSEDRDEVLEQAAVAAAEYNQDVLPSSYREDLNLSKEAEEAKSNEDALAFADKIDQLAEDIGDHRGNPNQVFALREYAQRIRDLVAKRNNQQPEQGLGQDSPKA